MRRFRHTELELETMPWVRGLHTSTRSCDTDLCILSCSRWPEHMYAVDMKDGFALVDSLMMKEHYKKLIDRVAAVFQ